VELPLATHARDQGEDLGGFILHNLPMPPNDQPSESAESSFGWKLELGLVSLFSFLALVAYCVVYWPWKAEFPGTPLDFFAALPCLVVTAAAALSLGSRKVVAFWQDRLDKQPLTAWVYPTVVWALYAGGTLIAGHGNPRQIGGLALYLACPVAIALLGKAHAGRWIGVLADWLMILAAWIPIQLEWLYLPNMPVPGAHDQIQVHPLFAACVAFWAIMVVRRIDGFAFRLVFSKEDFLFGVRLFALFAAVMLPLSLAVGFADPSNFMTVHVKLGVPAWAAYPLLPIGMYFGVALVEEALFRGLLQNLLGKTLRSPWAGLVIASLVFGAVHYKPRSDGRGGTKLWFFEYAIFAAIAGGVYGYAYLKTKRIMPGAVAHALVNSLWLTLFNPSIYGK
jgi:membrane protease YdiL (CAAX protease family)